MIKKVETHKIKNIKEIKNIKTQFPIFKRYPKLVYLDSAATSQKPAAVINRIKKFYEEECANIHRGIYRLSEKATKEYEAVRNKVAEFIHARSAKEIVFTSGATESINLVAASWGQNNLTNDDEIVLTEMEHHSNLVPWQELIKNSKLKIQNCNLKLKINNRTIEQSNNLKFISITHNGQLDLDQLPKLVTKKTKLVALTFISNVLGTINPVAEIVKAVKKLNSKCLVLVDAAQAVPHMPVDVQELGCDFLVFSGHKMLGPTGVGVLWARQELLAAMEPFKTGGGMISKVDQYQSSWAAAPYKFEAGTPNIAGVIGLGAAIDFLQKLGMSNICRYEEELTVYALEKLASISGIEIYGQQKIERCGCEGCGKGFKSCKDLKPFHRACKNRLGIISFNVKAVHAHDVAQILDQNNIAVRAGHHCAMPLHAKLGKPATVRASFYLYNNKTDVDKLVEGIQKVSKVFK